MDARRALPSVHGLLEHALLRPLVARAPRSLVTGAVRAVIDRARQDPDTAPRDDSAWAAAVETALAALERPSLRPVYNATGVILHTNLGRAPLADAALTAIQETAAGYCNLEYDIERGIRGSRYVHCVALLRELTGAEDAMIVNNCAAALVLALNTRADGRDALVSRGELIEIGGSFRVPDIMKKSGARLVEIGTTNRTYVDDYASAITDRAAAIVKVHRSNFAIDGFVADASLRDLAPLARAHGLALIHDFGSGLLIPLDRYGLGGEPTVTDAVRAGASVVVMSGDKLLGGPQAGILVGESAFIAQLRENPLARAFRVDKLTIAALEATLTLYRDPEHAVERIPTLSMLTASGAFVHDRAVAIAHHLRTHGIAADVVPSVATVGGGAFPTARIPSTAIGLPRDPVATEARLRAARPAIVARIADGMVLVDVRSIPVRDDAGLCAALVGALA